ncbi:MAG: hypothetical protein AABZ47_10210 [Planctomycetota bacterium]
MLRSTGLLIGTAILSLIIGCPMNPASVDDDLLSFSVVVGGGFGVAEREGDFTTSTNDNVFDCRSTSMRDDLLTQNAFFAAAPNHRLTLTEAIAGLSVQVISNSEIVLWIRNGSNNFCNRANENSISRGSWSAGDYDIFIGTPDPNETIEYTLRITE